jgi:hypothetical protein
MELDARPSSFCALHPVRFLGNPSGLFLDELLPAQGSTPYGRLPWAFSGSATFGAEKKTAGNGYYQRVIYYHRCRPFVIGQLAIMCNDVTFTAVYGVFHITSD